MLCPWLYICMCVCVCVYVCVFVYVYMFVCRCGCWFWVCTGPFSLSYSISHSTSPIGDLPMRLFVLLLEGKANLKNTGTITLPAADVIEQASTDLKERFDAIDSIDLSGLKNLEGRWACVSSENCSCVCVCVCACVWVWGMYRAILSVVRHLTLHISHR